MSVHDIFGSEPSDAEREWLEREPEAPADETPFVVNSWTPKKLSSVSDEPPQPPTLGGLGLVYPGMRHLFSGPPESAKTIAAYIVALSVVREGGSVVLVDFEMGEIEAKRRFRELGATETELARILHLEPETAATREDIDALIALGPSLTIIDSLVGAFALQGLDDNSRKDVETWAQLWVDPFKKKQIATLVIDHVTKNADNRGAFAIGSERKGGQVDAHLGFVAIHPIRRGTKGTYKITTHKDRSGFHKRGTLANMELVSEPESHTLTWTFKMATESDPDHPFRPTVKMEQASRWLEKQMEENVPMGHIENGIKGDRNTAQLAINILVEEGWFIETAGPRGARLMTVARAYREDFDAATSLQRGGDFEALNSEVNESSEVSDVSESKAHNQAKNDLAATSLDLAENHGSSDLATSLPPLQGQRGETESSPESARSQFSTDDIPF